MILKLYSNMENGLKLQVRKILELNPTLFRNYREKMLGSFFASPYPE